MTVYLVVEGRKRDNTRTFNITPPVPVEALAGAQAYIFDDLECEDGTTGKDEAIKFAESMVKEDETSHWYTFGIWQDRFQYVAWTHWHEFHNNGNVLTLYVK